MAADQIETLFTIGRTNYKPYKTLHVNLHYQDTFCTISNETVLDVFYIDNRDGSRIDMSRASQKYFKPKILFLNDQRTILDFTMYALEKATLLPRENRKVAVELIKTPNGCSTSPKIRYQNENLELVSIVITMKKLFGRSIGLKKIKMSTLNKFGESKVIVLTN